MSKKNQPVSAESPGALFDRVAIILEQARGNVVRAVNTNMVRAYWLIGREIVMELQGGEERAEYGKRIVEDLSSRLTERYGKGYSGRNLKSFRQFYLAYRDRLIIVPPLGAQFLEEPNMPPMGAQSELYSPMGRKLPLPQKSALPGDELSRGFSPQLTWSHYRALMRVDNLEARDFYEREAIEGGWDKRTLERQIQSLYYERMFDDLFVAPDDNPTIGLILCTEKNETVARYSVLNDRKQIFASKYMLCLPTEEQLRLEVEKEREAIEEQENQRHDD